MTFQSFRLENAAWDGSCNFDYVSAYEGSTPDEANLIGLLKIHKKTMAYIWVKYDILADKLSGLFVL